MFTIAPVKGNAHGGSCDAFVFRLDRAGNWPQTPGRFPLRQSSVESRKGAGPGPTAALRSMSMPQIRNFRERIDIVPKPANEGSVSVSRQRDAEPLPYIISDPSNADQFRT